MGAGVCISERRVARELSDVHDRVELRLRRNSGNCDTREAGGSRQEVRNKKGKLCAINGARLQLECSRQW